MLAALHISVQAALSSAGRPWPPKSPGAGPRSSRPPSSAVGVGPARRGGDAADPAWPSSCRRRVQRRQHVFGEFAGFTQSRLGKSIGEIGIQTIA